MQEEREERQALSKKAQSMMEEKDDEIKKLNEAILNAKCHAIRDLQLHEREEIKKALAEEETRLDEMMEVERRNALQMYEERERERQLQRLKLDPCISVTSEQSVVGSLCVNACPSPPFFPSFSLP